MTRPLLPSKGRPFFFFFSSHKGTFLKLGLRFFAAGAAVVTCAFAAACGSGGADSTANAGLPTDTTSSSTSSSSGGSSKPAPSSSSPPTDDPTNPSCPSGTKTTLSGRVYDPAGSTPLPHVVVYVPGKTPPPAFTNSLTSGIACETCADVAIGAKTSTITDAKGEFVLEDVPVAPNVEVVVQTGKWRRSVKVEVAKACADNAVDDGTLRLPRKASEGNMPHIAVTTGSCDAFECLLRGTGIDLTEFVAGETSTGHVHIFKGEGGQLGNDASTDLWNDASKLKKYDAVLLSCECDENLTNKGGTDPNARGAMHDYLDAGGRVLASHYQYVWFKNSPQTDFQGVAAWTPDGFDPDGSYPVNTSFPKGNDLSTWLSANGASSLAGQVPLKNVRSAVSSVSTDASSWIANPAKPPKLFSFATPMGAAPAAQCGRAMYSDFHAVDAGGASAIGSCTTLPGALDPQQKALEYMIFDLTGCAQPDSDPPAVPSK